jgi:predicted nucleotidyltransferase
MAAHDDPEHLLPTGPFDPEQHQRQKHGDEVSYWSPEDFARRYPVVIQAVGKTLKDLEKEFRSAYGAGSDIDGVLIYGSWARTKLEGKVWVHADSDLDLVLLTRADIGNLREKFEDTLNHHLKGRLPAEVSGRVQYTDPKGVLQATQLGDTALHVDQPAIVVMSRAIPEAHAPIGDFIKQLGFQQVVVEVA